MAIERIIPGTKEWDAYYANHIGRYMFAEEQVKEGAQNMLDAACGVGYGSNYLGKNAQWKITGIDRSDEALQIANKNFKRDNVSFLKDDCHTLLAAQQYGPFSTIVSLETLEHLPKPDDFLRSSYQNLIDGGILIVSTPNIYVSSPDGKVTWEYHEKEYTPKEFLEILQTAGFGDIKMYGQQLNERGRLKKEIREELNRVHSNPFMRLGRLIQKVFRGHKDKAILPESFKDIDFINYSNDIDKVEALGIDGPFVLIAVAKK